MTHTYNLIEARISMVVGKIKLKIRKKKKEKESDRQFSKTSPVCLFFSSFQIR